MFKDKEKFKIDAILGTINMSLKDIKNLEKGSVIDLKIPAGENVKCFHKDKYLFEGEIMVFEKNLAVRISNRKKGLELKQIKKHKIDSIQSKKRTTEVFDFLSEIDPNELADFIVTEHPQIIALILSFLEPKKTSIVLEHFPLDLQTEVIMRMSNIGNVSPIFISQISDTLEEKIKELKNLKFEIGGIKLVKEIFKEMNTEDILKQISEVDSLLVKALKE